MYKNKAADGENNLCGQKVREIRKQLPEKTSQRKLADMLQLEGLDLDKNAVQRIESGKRFVTERLLQELGSAGRPVIPVLNKWDAVAGAEFAPHLPGAVRLSALNGTGIDQLLQKVEENLPEKMFEVELLLPFSKSGMAARLREDGAVLKEEYVAEGLRVTARVDERLYGLVREFDLQPREEEQEPWL